MASSTSSGSSASSTTYWITGLSRTGSISLGVHLVPGRKRVPRPAAGMIAFILFKDPFAGAKRPKRAARRPQTKLRYRSILPPETYVAVRQTQFFSRSTQIIARMVQFYAPAVTGLARRRQRCSACRAMGMRGQNKKDGARNANPVCKEIWRESLIT